MDSKPSRERRSAARSRATVSSRRPCALRCAEHATRRHFGAWGQVGSSSSVLMVLLANLIRKQTPRDEVSITDVYANPDSSPKRRIKSQAHAAPYTTGVGAAHDWSSVGRVPSCLPCACGNETVCQNTENRFTPYSDFGYTPFARSSAIASLTSPLSSSDSSGQSLNVIRPTPMDEREYVPNSITAYSGACGARPTES
jgi:hypothetical protein